MRRLWLLLLAGCVSDLTYHCDDTHTCDNGGVCISGGCAQAATDCPSGLRFNDDSPTKGCVQGAPPDLAGMDLAHAPVPDLTGADFAGADLTPLPDLSTGVLPDLTGADLAGADLAMIPDLAPPCVPTGAEDCFNNVDDDCDGKVDCADTDCQTGNECAPDPTANFSAGTIVTQVQSCPAGYSAGHTDINQGVMFSGACTGCSCAPRLDCATTIFDYGGNACPAGSTVDSFDITGSSDSSINTCTTGPPSHAANTMNITSGKIKVGAMIPTSTCPGVGTPTKPPLTWQQQTRFCKATATGGGCTPGNVCVPKTATKHCVLQTGNVVCPTGYAQEGGMSWFTGADDSARTCGASCTCSKSSDGLCGTSQALLGINNSTCATPATLINSGASNCFANTTGYKSAEVMLSGTTLPSCSVSNTLSGAPVLQGETTLCCR